MSDLVAMQQKHTRSYILHKNKLENERPVNKTLIKYSSNSLENDEEEKKQIDIEFTEQNADLENDIALDDHV